MKNFQFKINGKIYDVELLSVDSNTKNDANESSTLQNNENLQNTKSNSPSHALHRAETKNYVLSPLPGILRNYCVKIGDTVKKGDTVLVLEAMKMENNIFAEYDGVVLELIGQVGNAILEGEKLIALG